MAKSRLFVISAPSATGKTTIIKRLTNYFGESLKRVVTCTTREIREDEVNGIDYHFISQKQFIIWKNEKKFLECAKVYDNYYGVLSKDLNNSGYKIISLDRTGVSNLKQLGVDAIYILIKPPSIEVLKNRMLKRNTESEQESAYRISQAEKEMSEDYLYDHVVVNDQLEKAIDDCKKIIEKEIH